MFSSGVPACSNVNADASGAQKSNNVDAAVNADASPVMRSVKRVLNISPLTPVGLTRKQLFRENLHEITYNEDIEMTDLEFKESEKGMFGISTDGKGDGNQSKGEVGDRRLAKGIRRTNITNNGKNLKNIVHCKGRLTFEDCINQANKARVEDRVRDSHEPDGPQGIMSLRT